MKIEMKQRYGLIRRAWGVFYAKDKLTGRQESLDTRNKPEALRILHAKNEAEIQPMINLQMARAYLSATDPAGPRGPGSSSWTRRPKPNTRPRSTAGGSP